MLGLIKFAWRLLVDKQLKPTWAYASDLNAPIPHELLQAAGQSHLLARLLWNRHVRHKTDILEFLSVETAHDPDPYELPDAELALQRLEQALHNEQPILIYGDFDVDGITGTAIWLEALKALGATVSYFVPNRQAEGHGLHSAALCRLVSSRNIKLVVTTDTGISNFSEISLLQGLGVDTIVTDHHEVPEVLPPSVANVNPQRLSDSSHSLKNLSGAGVAYLLATELLARQLSPEAAKQASEYLLDLTAIGLIADMVPLQAASRSLAYLGLKQIATRKRLGLRLLLERAGLEPDAPIQADTVGFTIGPRLNAIGRLEDATEAVELLTTDDPERAQQLVNHLEHLNERRKQLCDKTYLQAEQALQLQGGLSDKTAIILASPDWNPGVIGIVASRLIERYQVPTFLMVVDSTTDEARCSARSVPDVHLTECLDQVEHYFTRYGGHAGAAGFSLPFSKLEALKTDLYRIIQAARSQVEVTPRYLIDADLQCEQVNEGLMTLQDQLAPYGMGNPSPLYRLSQCQVSTQRFLGEAKKHLKCLLSDSSGHKVETFLWNHSERLPEHEKLDCLVHVERHSFRGETSVRLQLVDWCHSHEHSSRSVSPLLQKKELITPSLHKKAPISLDDRRDPSLSLALEKDLCTDQSDTTQVYYEGRLPQEGFWPKGCLKSRSQLRRCNTLVLWDLPPSSEVLENLISRCEPSTVQLVGAKYREGIPILAPTLFLQGISQQLDQANGLLSLVTLQERLATNLVVARLGLSYLNYCVGIDLSYLDKPETISLLAGQAPATHQLKKHLEHTEYTSTSPLWAAFQDAIQASYRFRKSLQQNPIQEIAAQLGLSALESRASSYLSKGAV